LLFQALPPGGGIDTLPAMRAFLPVLCAVVLAGCASVGHSPKPTSAAIPATEAQTNLAVLRAQAIASRMDEAKITKLRKSGTPFLAVRTLNLTPEQAAQLKHLLPSGNPAELICVVVWNAATDKEASSECYVLKTAPEVGKPVTLGEYTAEYVGSR